MEKKVLEKGKLKLNVPGAGIELPRELEEEAIELWVMELKRKANVASKERGREDHQKKKEYEFEKGGGGGGEGEV